MSAIFRSARLLVACAAASLVLLAACTPAADLQATTDAGNAVHATETQGAMMSMGATQTQDAMMMLQGTQTEAAMGALPAATGTPEAAVAGATGTACGMMMDTMHAGETQTAMDAMHAMQTATAMAPATEDDAMTPALATGASVHATQTEAMMDSMAMTSTAMAMSTAMVGCGQ